MPYDDPDPTDPMTLHGVGLRTGSEAANVEMAECFVEEYFRLGFAAERILEIFQKRGFAGPYMASQVLGIEAIERIIGEVEARSRPRTSGNRLERRSNGSLILPVLD